MPELSKFSLDVDSPNEVPDVLRDVAEEYYQTASELESAWQDRNASRPWIIIARTLEQAADKIETQLKRYGY